MAVVHKSVLKKEALSALNIKPGNIVLDGTVNGGGHAKEICKRLGENGVFIGLDLDTDALERAKEQLKDAPCKVFLKESNYRDFEKVIEELGIKQIDAFLLDLGLNSTQLEESGRGFTFQRDEPLLMTFKKDIAPSDLTAIEILNTWSEEHIADVIYGYGEERFARAIAKKIVSYRNTKPFKTTFDLVKVVEEAIPKRYQHGKTHSATKVFQALRIVVNDEIGALEQGLEKAVKYLSKEGRLAVITFHSIEDRVVKHYFLKKKKEEVGIILTKKPIIPNREEIIENKRARSAKLRIFQKII